MRVEFTIEGPPVGKARPRVTRTGTFNPPKSDHYEKLVRYTAINSFNGCFELDEPLDVKIVAYLSLILKSAERNSIPLGAISLLNIIVTPPFQNQYAFLHLKSYLKLFLNHHLRFAHYLIRNLQAQ